MGINIKSSFSKSIETAFIICICIVGYLYFRMPEQAAKFKYGLMYLKELVEMNFN